MPLYPPSFPPHALFVLAFRKSELCKKTDGFFFFRGFFPDFLLLFFGSPPSENRKPLLLWEIYSCFPNDNPFFIFYAIQNFSVEKFSFSFLLMAFDSLLFFFFSWTPEIRSESRCNLLIEPPNAPSCCFLSYRKNGLPMRLPRDKAFL